jgi:hypothetical protein
VSESGLVVASEKRSNPTNNRSISISMSYYCVQKSSPEIAGQRKPKWKSRFFWSIGVILLMNLAAASHAATRSWTGAVSPDWFTAGNWQPPGVPAAGDSVTITNSAAVTLPQSAAIANMNLHGTLNGPGTLSLAGTMNWTAGDIRLPLVISASANLNILGEAEKRLPGGTIRNAGTIIWTGGGAIVGFSDGKIENSGTFEAQNDDTLTFCCAHPMAAFHNLPSGTFRKRNSTGETVMGDFLFLNEGLVDVQSGTLILRAQNHQLKAGGRFSGAGRTVLTEATISITGASRIETGGTVEFRSGVLAGDGAFNGPGTLEWTQGDIAGSLTVGPGTKLNIAGDADKRLTGGVLNIAGSALSPLLLLRLSGCHLQ